MSSTAVRTRDRMTATRELNWFDGTYPEVLSRDGRTLMFTERGKTAIGRGEVYPIFVRPTAGGPAKNIGVGYGVAFSPDGRWALTRTRQALGEVSKLILYALRTGEQKTLDGTGLQSRGIPASFAGPRTILSVGRASGQSETRTFAQDIGGGPPVMLSHEPGVLASPVAPDGNHFISRRRDGSRWLATITASESSPLPGTFNANEGIMEWTPDGRSVYVSTINGDQLTVATRDLATGREAPVIELQPSVRQGFWGWASPLVTPEGRTFVTREHRIISLLRTMFLLTTVACNATGYIWGAEHCAQGSAPPVRGELPEGLERGHRGQAPQDAHLPRCAGGPRRTAQPSPVEGTTF